MAWGLSGALWKGVKKQRSPLVYKKMIDSTDFYTQQNCLWHVKLEQKSKVLLLTYSFSDY